MGKKSKKKDLVEEIFPTAQARKAADEAIEPIESSQPMWVFIDEWYKAYVAAGGKVNGEW